jgi:hypothetical protein
MVIFVTPDEVIALSDAIVCYLGYLQRTFTKVQECAETVRLLQCFQQRLVARVLQAGTQSGEVQP